MVGLSLCNKLPAEQLAAHSNDMMQGFLHVFNSKSAEVHEEALMAISALALAIDRLALARAVAPPGMGEATVTASVATGPFNANSPWGGAHPPLPTDTVQAASLLDAAGWTVGANGFRQKAGVTLDM